MDVVLWRQRNTVTDDTRGGEPPALERETAWRELVHRMMQPVPVEVVPTEPETEFFPGGIPPNLPVDVPLPGYGRVVGTVLNERGRKGFTLYLDAKGAVPELLDFYRDHLQPRGWREVGTAPHTVDGFNDADESSRGRAVFYHSEQEYTLLVCVTRAQDEPAAVRIQVDRGAGPPSVPSEPQSPPVSTIPSLPLPPGASIVMGAGPASVHRPGSAHSSIQIEIESDLVAVADYYTLHLRRGGWTETASNQHGESFWSVWTFKNGAGHAWHGLLFVLQRPDFEHRYVAQVWAECEQ